MDYKIYQEERKALIRKQEELNKERDALDKKFAEEHPINTLKAKEVDLEKEFIDFLDNVEGMPRMWHSDEQMEWGKDIAKHFFELGLKTQKEEISECFNKDDFIKKVYEWLKGYAFVNDENNVHLPTLLHDFLKYSRII